MIQATMTETLLTRIAELKIRGHAMSAPYGHDIVCASVSTLSAMLGHSFNAIVHDNGNDFQVTASLKQGGNRRLWLAAKKTLEQLAHQYPENVEFEYVTLHG